MKKYWFWFFLAAISVCLVVLLWLNQQTNITPESSSMPIETTQTPTWPTLDPIQNTPAPEVPSAKKNYILPKLPYETAGFLVEYLPKSQKFYVSIKPSDYLSNYEQAILWLNQQQIPNPQNNQQVHFVYLERE